MTKRVRRSNRNDSMVDRANVRGARSTRKNKKVRGRRGWGTVRRAVLGCAGVVIAMVLVSTVQNLAPAAKTFVAESHVFTIDRIEIEGIERASSETIARLAGVHAGDSLLLVDPEAVAAAVSAHPWVAEVDVLRRFPDRLRIRVREHHPKLLVALGHLYYASEDGEIVKRHAPGEAVDLPVVTGMSREAVESDDGETKARLRMAARFVSELEKTLGKDAPKVSSLHLDPMLGVTFEVSDEDLTVVMGMPPWKERMMRFDEVRGALAKQGVTASRILLGGERRKDRVVAKLGAVRSE